MRMNLALLRCVYAKKEHLPVGGQGGEYEGTKDTEKPILPHMQSLLLERELPSPQAGDTSRERPPPPMPLGVGGVVVSGGASNLGR